MPQVRGHRRKHSRSLSPVPSKHKRSWQNEDEDRFSGGGGGGGGRLQHHHRSPSPVRGGRKDFRSPEKINDRRHYLGTPGTLRKSRSPHSHKRSRPRSPLAGRGTGPPYPRHSIDPSAGSRDKSGSASHHNVGRSASNHNDGRSTSHHNDGRSGSGFKPRPFSERTHQTVRDDRNKHDALKVRRLPSPRTGPSLKKKSRHSVSSLSPVPKRSRSQSRDQLLATSIQTKNDSSSAQAASIPQRKVSTGSKRKPPRLTLHKRFTLEDQDVFELEENVTIAILRKPDAQPSEDVTVKRVFDSSQFKMIHKKTEGKKPIFDREEIKVWRHDDNLADDPDYERRLVRVKSGSGTSKSASDGVTQMSPDVIRKAIGLQSGARSNRSPQTEPLIRLVPLPDPRYESKFRQQIEREEELGNIKGRGDDKKAGARDRRGSSGNNRGDGKDRKWEEHKRGEKGKEETYDLRQALERRRSDREEGSFRIEVRRDSNPEAELFYRDGQQGVGPSGDHRRFVQDSGGSGSGDRNVVLDHDRARKRFSGSVDRDGGRSWRGRRFDGVRGRPERGRGRLGDWSQEREGDGEVDGVMEFKDGGRNFDRRQRYSNSPSSTRGWRGGFRGRGRGRQRDFVPYSQELEPAEFNDSYKYSQHDDRSMSPRSFRGRGGRGRFAPRSFGGNNFRTLNRGGPRGGRSYRGGYAGGGYGAQGDRRSMERQRDVSVDREWKHDMYDSLQAEEELLHSTSGT